LQEKLAEYAGTVLLASHDRDFLDRVVTSLIVSERNGRWIEYAGGYTDMLAQRAAAGRGSLSAKARAVKQSTPDTQGKGSTSRRLPRMNFNDQRALETLPDQIAALQTQIAGLNAILADSDLYARGAAQFRAATQALAIAREELAAAEKRWLRLELLREEIEAAGPRS
jgi:ATP-binding cassette subfamily F protein uup